VASGTAHLDVGARDHVVQFYRRDDELAEHVSGYLLDAVRDGGVAIVIATAAHRRAFEAGLADAGIDVGAASSSGAYVTLDAGAAMHRLLIAGRLDPAAFEQVIGHLIQPAAETGRQVRVYGEIVALLWETGQVNAAIELEAQWNVLGRKYPFALFCGYPVRSVTAEGHDDAFAEVCQLHTEIIGVRPDASGADNAAEETSTFAASAAAPRAARHFVAQTLRQWGAGKVAVDAELVVTELATNAVVHARSGFTVAISDRGDAVRISVRDTSPLAAADPRFPLAAAPATGLGMVAAVAREWGTQLLGDEGKTVWAELRR
jgi:anti-sigma regulatory factor (Ser/Thr protein kinase)